jgi:hypothetical protein
MRRLLIFALLLNGAGCACRISSDDIGAQRAYEARRVIDAFESLMNRDTDSSQWQSNLLTISELAKYESPSLWAKVFTEASFPVERRQACLDHFLLRHCPPGTPLDRLAMIPEFSRWIASTNIYSTYGLSASPLQTRIGEPVFGITVVRGHPDIQPVYLRINKTINDSAFLAILRGELSNYDDLRITEIWTSSARSPK